MARKVPIPKIVYRQVEQPDQATVDAVFDYIFELLLKEKAKKKDLQPKE